MARLPGAVVLVPLVLATAAIPSQAAARCALGTTVEVWPRPGATQVVRNARIVIRAIGFGVDTEPIRGMGLTLTSAHDSPVPLRVVSDHSVSDPRPERTVVLEPTRLLRAGTRYRLSDLSAAELGLYVDDIRFETGQAVDDVAPSLAAATARPFVSVELGCGPAHWIPVDLSGVADDGQGQLFARIRVARSEAALQGGSYLGEAVEPLVGQESFLGHGMCSGNWPLEPGDRFFALVSVVDQSGNESQAYRLVLEAPAPSTAGRDGLD